MPALATPPETVTGMPPTSTVCVGIRSALAEQPQIAAAAARKSSPRPIPPIFQSSLMRLKNDSPLKTAMMWA